MLSNSTFNEPVNFIEKQKTKIFELRSLIQSKIIVSASTHTYLLIHFNSIFHIKSLNF